MRCCDLTFAYTPSSGGIRTYLDQKRRYLLERTPHEHVLIVPDEETSVERDGQSITFRIASPLLPGCEPYRFFCRPAALMEALREANPDVIELGSFFLEPWAAMRWRDEAASRRACVIAGYFHTDLANAYFGAPVRKALQSHVAEWSDLVAGWSTKFADAVESGATSYFGSIFRKCDLMFAATPQQMNRLRDYGVANPQLIPLGVDLDRFHPNRRSGELRAKFGADDDTVVLIYAGRLDTEKQVHVIADAFGQLRLPRAKLVLVGEGPLRDELEERARRTRGIHVLPFERNPALLAALLASSDIYVTAGPHETFGLSVIEAQAAGLPVVGVAAGALIERVVEGTGLLAPAGDAAAMARGVESVAALRWEMGAAARRHVETSGLGWTGTFERLIAAYEQARAAGGAGVLCA